MNILLVYPATPGAFWSMQHALEFTHYKAVYPPLGLLTVATMLPEEWNKRLVDINIEPLEDSDLAWADYVFIGGMYIQRQSAYEVIRRCNEAGVKVVAGGPFVTHEYDTIEGVDHFILNEAEITLPPFLEDLQNGNPKPIYRSADFANVHETPLPMWKLVNLDNYVEGLVQYSRGCPYHCDFCDVTALFGKRPRTKTPEQIIAELEGLGDLNRLNAVFFADDNLIGHKKRLKKELLPALIKWRKANNIRIRFRTQVTINLADDPELMDLMLQAGFSGIFIGIETPSTESLIACQKRQNTKRDLLDNIHHLQRAGFDISAGFIVGFDTDTPDIFDRQIEFIQRSGIVVSVVNVLKAIRGTQLYDRMMLEGRMYKETFDDESTSSFVPKMGANVLYQGFKRVVRHIYHPQHIYERLTTFLSMYQPMPYALPSLRTILRNVPAFVKSLYGLGIRDDARRFYWKLLGWTLLNHPKLLPIAIEMWIMTYHYRKIYEDDDRFILSDEGREVIPAPSALHTPSLQPALSA